MFGHSYRGSDEMNQSTWIDSGHTELVYCIWPRKCSLTNKWMYFQRAYCVTVASRYDDNNFLYEYRWYDPEEFIFFRLRNGI